jgi:tetratricopeptide (TPR) repeat protein
MVYSTALLERAWLEFERSHARERAILQMQALADQHTNRLTLTQSTRESVEDSAPAQERLRNLHSIVYPPRWSMIEDLADRYASLGIVSSAAELYSEIELWDSVVDCYRRAGRITHAEKIVRERLAIEETPRMWAALGDLTEDPVYYEKAVELSRGRYADAYLALGAHYFEKGDRDLSADNYRKALKVRPLNPAAWFRLGTIYMQLKQWQEALKAFSEVVMQEPEEGEAWANIAAIHMHNKQPAEAYPALNESLKHQRSNWRVWVSKLYTCLDLGKYDEAIQACNILLDLRIERKASAGVPPLEEKCVRAIVGGSLKCFKESEGDEAALDAARRTLSRVHALLNRISASSEIEYDTWIFETIAFFHQETSHDSEKVLDALMKDYRSLQMNAGWERDVHLVRKMCQVVSQIVQIYLHKSENAKGNLTKARFVARGVIQRIQTFQLADASIPIEVKHLQDLLDKIAALLQETNT